MFYNLQFFWPKSLSTNLQDLLQKNVDSTTKGWDWDFHWHLTVNSTEFWLKQVNLKPNARESWETSTLCCIPHIVVAVARDTSSVLVEREMRDKETCELKVLLVMRHNSRGGGSLSNMHETQAGKACMFTSWNNMKYLQNIHLYF